MCGISGITSQHAISGETLDAIWFAKERGARTAAVGNAMGSSLTRLVDHAITQGSGPEICVVSTKAALGQIVVLLRVAAALERLSGETDDAVTRDLAALPDAIRELIEERSGEIAALTKAHSHIGSWPFLGNAEEVKARGGHLIGTATDEGSEVFDEQIRLPKAPPLLAPLLHLVALQLFAYFTAVALRRNVNRPRSLAKSVTVG